jgi:hypothetical protein
MPGIGSPAARCGYVGEADDAILDTLFAILDVLANLAETPRRLRRHPVFLCIYAFVAASAALLLVAAITA